MQIEHHYNQNFSPTNDHKNMKKENIWHTKIPNRFYGDTQL